MPEQTIESQPTTETTQNVIEELKDIIGAESAENKLHANKKIKLICKSVAAVVPESLKPFIYKILDKSDSVRHAYIENLVGEKQKSEQRRLAWMYITQLQNSISLYETGEDISLVEKPLINVLHLVAVMHDPDLASHVVNLITRELNKTRFLSELKPIASNFLCRHGLKKTASVTSKVDIIVSCIQSGADQVSQVIRAIAHEESTILAEEVCCHPSVNPFEHTQVIVSLLNIVPSDKRTSLLVNLISNNIRKLDKESIKSAQMVRPFLDASPSAERIKIIEGIFTHNYQSPFSRKSGLTQTAQIIELTNNIQEQALIFWRISSHSLRYSSGNEYDEYIKYIPDFSWERLKVVEKLHKDQLISPETARKFARKYVQERISESPECYLEPLASILETFNVDFTILQEIATKRIQLAFQHSADIPSELVAFLPQLELQEITSQPTPFDLDIQASEQYGEQTWRPEQTLIDFLQNNLDAQAYRYVIRLLHAAYSDEVSSQDLLALQTNELVLTQLWNFSKRWPFNPQAPDASTCIPYEFSSRADVLAQKLETLPPLEIPKISVIVQSTEGAEQYVDYFSATETQLKNCVGVQYEDTGFGYDKNLNALFAPTKQSLPFLRGQFGQGTKMGLIALVRAGCAVHISSTVSDPNTGETKQWEGSAYHSDRTRSIRFRGTEVRAINSEAINQTGTITTIRFNNADNDTVQTFKQMLSRSNSSEGMGRYVLDLNKSESDYLYGSLETNSRVCTSYGMRNQQWVQGLQIPTISFPVTCAYSYDFANVNILTGRDRTYVDANKVTDEIGKIWSGIVNDNAIREYYYGLLSMHVSFFAPNPTSYEFTSLPSRLSWSLSKEAKEMHLSVLSEIFQLSDDSEVLVLTSEELKSIDQKDKEALKNADKLKIISTPSEESARLITNILGPNRVIKLSAALNRINKEQKSNAFLLSETIANECTQVAHEASQKLSALLISMGFSKVATALQNEPLQVRALKTHRSGTDPVSIYRNHVIESDKDYFSGVAIDVYPEAIGVAEQDEIVDTDKKNVLRALIFVRLCALIPRLGSNLPSIDYIAAQRIPNKLLDSYGAAKTDFHPVITSLNLPLKYSDVSKLLTTQTSKSEKKLDETIQRYKITEKFTRILFDISQSVEELQELVTTINHPNIQSHIRSAVFEHLRNLNLLDRPFTCIQGRFILQFIPQDNALSIAELHAKSIGYKDEYEVAQEGEGEHAALIVPFDFSNTDVALITIENTTTPISKFTTFSSNPATANLYDDPALFFSHTSSLPGRYFQQTAYAGKNCLIFPIGSSDPSLVEKRANYFMNQLPLLVSSELPTANEETNSQVSYIETNASTDYGQGAVWDDPIRVFSEIFQNHIDAGNPTLKYQINGNEVVTEAELLDPRNESAEITGFIFADEGTGYTTDGLTKWGDSTKTTSGKIGRYGEGQKMLVVSAARNGIDLTLSSRNWSAHVTSRTKTILANGSSKQIDIVGYDMDWVETERVGSETAIHLNKNPEPAQKQLWQNWLAVLDPRKNVDENGNRGLSRYVRELRAQSENEIKIGNVTILTDESNQIYEHGLVIPEVTKKLGINLLFSVDISDRIIATQERNMVDRAKLTSILENAYKHAPYELCVAVFKKLQIFLELQKYGLDPNSVPQLGVDTANFLEFKLIANVADQSKLASAFLEVFGANTIMSNMTEAEYKSSHTYDFVTHQERTEKELSFYRGLIAFESTNFRPNSLVDFGTELAPLKAALEPHVLSTKKLYESMLQEPMNLEKKQIEQLQELVQNVAADLLLVLNKIYSTPAGKTVLDSIYQNQSPSIFLQDALPFDLNKIEYARYFLSGIASGELKLEVSVLENMLGAAAFVDGPATLTFAGQTLLNPGLTIGTTIHELLHLAFRVRDYNSSFATLLLLLNPVIGKDLFITK